MTTIKRKTGLLGTVALAAAVVLGGCGDEGLFDVKNPGKILDEDLNTPEGVAALVTGMSSDFSSSYDGISFLTARLSDEMAGSGSYFETGRLRRGLMDSEDANGSWAGVQRARWVAEGGLERMRALDEYQFDGNELTAKAYLLAGLANRWFGENFCEVVFSAPYEGDDGTVQPRSTAFTRAVPHFESAISQGQSAGRSDIVAAAHGGLASVLAWTGDWAGAMQHSAQVPTDFVWNAVYSSNSGREENVIYNETHGRHEMSAFGALAGTATDGSDPRAPWTDCTVANCSSENGADGTTPHYRQEKYPSVGGDIPLVKGTEMRLLEAEKALNDDDITTAMAKINEARAHYGLAPLTSDGTVGSITGDRDSMSGWDILDRERHLTNWLEGRRLWDLHRWGHPFLAGGGVVYEATVNPRASCLPVALDECQTNTNIPQGTCFSM